MIGRGDRCEADAEELEQLREENERLREEVERLEHELAVAEFGNWIQEELIDSLLPEGIPPIDDRVKAVEEAEA